MRCFPNVTLVGDKTGGGSGLPFSSELPNGWGVRFSASPHLDAQKQHIEFGIDPDKKVDMSKEDENNDLDTIIEEARKNAESDFLKRLYLKNNLPKRKFFLSLPPLIGIIPRMWRNW